MTDLPPLMDLSMTPGAIETAIPSHGCRPPRSHHRNREARTLDLSGRWRFRLHEHADTALPDAEDADAAEGWGEIDVPGHWVLQGHGDPLYTNTAYPFPIDPPRVPQENPTADHVRRFVVSAGWRIDGSTVLFHGVDAGARVWLNGVELGWFTGSRLPAEFDISEMLREGENTLLVRVYRWSAGSYLEDQDMWWLPGIFREVLICEGSDIDDVAIRADYDHTTGSGLLRVDVTDRWGQPVAAMIDVPELGLSAVAANAEHRIEGVGPWSAPSPRLYDVRVTHGAAWVTLRAGFRTIAIIDGRFTVNGVPLRMHGVNRHEHDWERGRTLTFEQMRADVVLMKQHNIDAVRTAHYPPHPAFLDLCDEWGLWVVEECDIETHGFIYDGWQRNPPTDPAWTPALLDRTARMVERDKSHPSVIIWSLANESEGGEGFDSVAAWIRERDPSRPLHYERDRTYRNSDFYSLMYPSLDDLAAIGRREEPTPDVLAEDEEGELRRRALPFLLCEYAHAMGNGPGSLADYEAVFEGSDRFCGAFVWEWIDHGWRAETADGVTYTRHGGDIDYQPNGGRYCLDGLLFADRTPSPGLAELAAVNAPVRIDIAGPQVRVTSRLPFRDTSHLAFSWEATHDGVPFAGGDLAIEPLNDGEHGQVFLDVPAAPPSAGEVWLTVAARLHSDEPWAPVGHVVALAQGQIERSDQGVEDLNTPGPQPTLAQPARSGGRIALGPAVLDARTGMLRSFGDVAVDGPRVQVWRAPTENDHGQGALNNQVQIWRAVGLDRMLRRTDGVEIDPAGAVVVHGFLAPASQPFGLRTQMRWVEVAANAVRLEVDVTPEGPWHETPYGAHAIVLPRLGVRLDLPGQYEDVTWFGLGPGEAYADSHAAAWVGRWSSAIDELGTDYPFPQENGNRHQVRWAQLRGPGLPMMRLTMHGVADLAIRRCTDEDLDRAAKPHEVPRRETMYVHIDYAQRGLGSSSCGPELPSRYEIPLVPTRVAFEWETLGDVV